MIRVEVRDHNVRQAVEIDTGLFEAHHRIAHTVHQNGALLAEDHEMGVLMFSGRHRIRRTKDDNFWHWKLIAAIMAKRRVESNGALYKSRRAPRRRATAGQLPRRPGTSLPAKATGFLRDFYRPAV